MITPAEYYDLCNDPDAVWSERRGIFFNDYLSRVAEQHSDFRRIYEDWQAYYAAKFGSRRDDYYIRLYPQRPHEAALCGQIGLF